MPIPTAHRPPLPALGLPSAPRRWGPGVLLAVAVHAGLLGALIWERTNYLQGAMGGEGPQGGGGGGGERMTYVALPPAAAPREAETPQPPVIETPVAVPQALAVIEPIKIEIAPVAITPVPVLVAGVGRGTGGGPGQESGSGGGSGTGTGSHDGPGSGGGVGGDIIPADPIGIFIPPTCARGEIAVTFSVEANGRVSRVELDPSPRDASCRRELTEKLQSYRFRPATRDGKPVASRFPGKVIAN